MRRLRSLALVLPLFAAACGGGIDPETAAVDGRDALAARNHDAAVEYFDVALEGLDASSPDYVSLKIGRLQALAHLEGKGEEVVEEMEALNAEITDDTRLLPRDFKLVTTDLVSAGQYEPAAWVMDLGVKRYPGDPTMKEVADKVVLAVESAGDEGALSALDGMGYLGGGD